MKRGWWKSGKNGDVWVFVAGLMLLNAVYEVHPNAVNSSLVKRGLGILRGEDAKQVGDQGKQDTVKPSKDA